MQKVNNVTFVKIAHTRIGLFVVWEGRAKSYLALLLGCLGYSVIPSREAQST